MTEEVVEMRDINERPVCHRAEDLVSYLYSETGELETPDFREHLKACDACRTEFSVLSQVHDSIVVWRNEVLGSSFSSAPVMTESLAVGGENFRREEKLSAMATIRELFRVSPLWLRAATGFAAVLLCVLAIVAISRVSRQPVSQPVLPPVSIAKANPELKYTQKDLDSAVQKGIDAKLAELSNRQVTSANQTPAVNSKAQPQVEVAAYRAQSKRARPKGLTLHER